MKKSSPARAAAALAAVVLLSGCAAPSGDGKASPSTSPAKHVVLTPVQEQTLRSELRSVDTALDTPRAVPNAMMMCKAMLRGMPERAQREQAERIFFRSGDPAAPVPEGAAGRIIEVIKANGFCHA